MNDIQVRYDQEDDVLMIWFAKDILVDHAEQVGQSIMHTGSSGEPVLLEILNARAFVVDLVRTALTPTETT